MFVGRREFIFGSVAAGAVLSGCAAKSASALTQNWTERAGVQLYTFKDMMAENAIETLKIIAATGYKEVEFAGLFDVSPQEYRSVMDGEGLTAPGGHTQYNDCGDEKKFAQAIETALSLGQEYMVIPYLQPEQRTNLDDYRRVAENLTAWAAVCKSAGLMFAYHNHEFEFMELEGQIPYDILLSETDSDLVKMELDLCWIHAAGVSAVSYIEAHPGRFPLFHVKDYNSNKEVCPVGTGDVDFVSVFAKAELAGLKHAYIEHDLVVDPVASVTQSFNYMKNAQIKIPKL